MVGAAMGLINQYIVDIGRQTGIEMQLALANILLTKYRAQHDEEFALFLAAAVANRVFSKLPDKAEAIRFVQQHLADIEQETRNLAKDHELCELITGAIYSQSYANHAVKGGRRGLVNPFLGYIRALSRAVTGGDYWDSVTSFREKLGYDVSQPLMNLVELGMFRPLPQNPNGKEIYSRVHTFAVRAGVPFK